MKNYSTYRIKKKKNNTNNLVSTFQYRCYKFIIKIKFIIVLFYKIKENF